MYPFKFEKVFIEKIWGGINLENKLKMTLPEKASIGESWEVSAHPNGMSIVANGELKGKTLVEIYDEYKEKLVGEKIYKEYGQTFPLLIKYLDINDKLSIQVHPEDEYAIKHHNELGKSESWYVIDASEDAKLILGLKKGINKEEFLEKAKANDFSDMFEEKRVKTGDFIDVNPGLVHASLEGSILIAEIQENSDITYRIYDFDRKENGVKRPLHLDRAAEVIDFSKEAQIIESTLEGNQKEKLLVAKKHYTIKKIKIDTQICDYEKDSFIIYSILDGKGLIKWDKEILEIGIGETVLIPCNMAVDVEGELEILRTIIE